MELGDDSQPSDGVPLSSICLSHDVISEFLSGIETGSGGLGFDSSHEEQQTSAQHPMTPVKSSAQDFSLLTSTPVRSASSNHVWLSPIRVQPEENSNFASVPMERDVTFGSSTRMDDLQDGLHFVSDVMGEKENLSPIGGAQPNYEGQHRSSAMCVVSELFSPKPNDDSVKEGAPESCQSFGRLLSDLQLDGDLASADDSLNYNIGNVSFSHIQCDF